MDRKPLLVAAAAVSLLAGSSFTALAAQEGPKTRAQVLAELQQARADGSFYAAGDGTPRGLARARLAEQEAARRADARDGGADGVQQGAGSYEAEVKKIDAAMAVTNVPASTTDEIRRLRADSQRMMKERKEKEAMLLIERAKKLLGIE
jgi:hypothetical protein